MRPQENLVLNSLKDLAVIDFFSCINSKTIKAIYIPSNDKALLYSDEYFSELFVPNENIILITKGLIGSVLGIPILTNSSNHSGENIDRVVFIYDVNSCGIPDSITSSIDELIPIIVYQPLHAFHRDDTWIKLGDKI